MEQAAAQRAQKAQQEVVKEGEVDVVRESVELLVRPPEVVTAQLIGHVSTVPL